MWHHQHLIEPSEGGVMMTDIVSYKTPMGFSGAIANRLVIRRQLEEIFDYREKALEKMFGKVRKGSNGFILSLVTHVKNTIFYPGKISDLKS